MALLLVIWLSAVPSKARDFALEPLRWEAAR